MSKVYSSIVAAWRIWNAWRGDHRLEQISFVDFVEQGFAYIDQGYQVGLVIAPIDEGGEVRIDPAIDAITWVWNEGRHFAQWRRCPMPAADACAAGIDRPEVAAPPRWTPTQAEWDAAFAPHVRTKDDAFAGDDPFAAATRDIARGS